MDARTRRVGEEGMKGLHSVAASELLMQVLEMRLHEADEEDENHQFEILISDTMQDKNSQQVIELSTTTVIYDQGPYDAVTIPVRCSCCNALTMTVRA